MQNRLEAKYQVKTQLLGPRKERNQQTNVLNRMVTWNGQKGISYATNQLCLKDAKAMTTPGTREEGRTKDEHEEVPNEQESTRYRAVIARCNYLSPDMPDITYAIKGLLGCWEGMWRSCFLLLEGLGSARQYGSACHQTICCVPVFQ